MQEQLAGTCSKLKEAKEQIQGNENMIRWLNLQARHSLADAPVAGAAVSVPNVKLAPLPCSAVSNSAKCMCHWGWSELQHAQ